MFAIALTDGHLLETLRTGRTGKVINFWTPTPWNIRGLQPDDRLYFLLKSPIRKIAGHGDFRRYANMRASEAWSAYGLGNGVASLDELVKSVDHFASMHSKNYAATADPEIGCIELSNPVFFPDDEFISPDTIGLSIPNKVMKLKYFTGLDPIKSNRHSVVVESFMLVEGIPERNLATRKKRVRASAFRKQIMANFNDRCCISGVALQEILEASHIQPYINDLSNHPQNGLCLRVDLHCLFDAGLITIDTHFKVVLSKQLLGTAYGALDQKCIELPIDPSLQPALLALEFHRSKVFRR